MDNFNVEIAEDNMEAYIIFYANPAPAEEEKSEIDVEDLKAELKKQKVIYGIDEELLVELAKDRVYNKKYIVATGLPRLNPVPGRIEYEFNIAKDYKPEVDGEGNVDFHKLSVISRVQEGDLLATLYQTTEGQNGYDVTGKELIPARGKMLRLLFGKNTRLSEDKLKLYADTAGMVKMVGDKITVSDVYEVHTNVGTSTGDIEFDGSILIEGNVITGFKVKAKNDIEVIGVVEGAELEAGGNIVLRSGVQGMGRSVIRAKGDIVTKFIEQATVYCDGNIRSEAILHSEVSCKGEIVVDGKKGMISGGKIRAREGVTSKILGSHMGTSTLIDVGVDPVLYDEYNQVKKDFARLTEELNKLEQVVNLLNKKKSFDGELDAKKAEMYKSAIKNKIIVANDLKVAEKRMKELGEILESRNSGSVIVRGNVYSGVRIGIAEVYYFVSEEISFVKFYKAGADVKLASL